MPDDTEQPPEQPTLLRNLWYASVGLAAVTGEQAGRIAGILVRKGREAEPGMREQSRRAAEEINQALAELREQVKIVADKVSRAAASAESAVDAKIAARIRQMGFSSKEEVEALKQKLAELNARLEELTRK